MIEQKETIEVKSLARPYLVKRGVCQFLLRLSSPLTVRFRSCEMSVTNGSCREEN